MASSGVGQFSINVKSNLKDFYGELNKSYKMMNELTDKKHALEIDSSQLDKLRDKSQRIASEMRELRQQKNEIKVGISGISKATTELSSIDKKINSLENKKMNINVDSKNADTKIAKINSELESLKSKRVTVSADSDNLESAKERMAQLDKSIVSLNRQKLAVDADIQPIRTANVELYKVNDEIDRINSKKIDIKVSDTLKSAGNAMTTLGDGLTKAFNPLTSKLNQMFGMGLINNLVDRGMNMVSDSVGGAIKRMDTLNNFEKVMSNMNIGSDQANKAKNDLVVGLDGLPTKLDEGVAAVQRFTSSNEDVEKSTKIFLALNDAILAGGASDEIQSSALEQISQSYAKGKPDMMEWRSLVTAMPAQVAQLGKAFGMSGDQLGEALRDGTISMDDFMAKIVELDKNGANGFKSFSEQARNAVGGVQTGIARMKSAVTRGVTDVITTIDQIAKDKGLGGISDVLYNIGKAFENGLGNIAKFISDNQEPIFNFFNGIWEFLSKLDYGGFIKGLGDGLSGFASDLKTVGNILKPLLGLVTGEGNAEKIGKLIPRLFELGVALKVLGGVTKGAGNIAGFFGKFGSFKFPSFGFGGKDGGIPMKNVGINDLKSLGLKMATVAGVSANIYLGAVALKKVDDVGDLKGLQPKMLAIAEAVTGMGILVLAIDKISTKLGSNVLAGVIAIAGIAGSIYVMAVALKKVNDVADDFSGIQKKIGQIALCIVEIGALALAVGAVASTGIGAVALIAGLASIIAIAGTLLVTAKALEKVGDMEIDEGAIKKTISTIYETIDKLLKESADVSLIDQIGAFFKTFLSSKILDQIYNVAKELEKVQKVKLEPKTMYKNLAMIQGIIYGLSVIGEDTNLSSLIGQSAEFLNTLIASGIVTNYEHIAKGLEQLQKIEIDKSKMHNNVATIQGILYGLKVLGEDTTLGDILNQTGVLLKDVKSGQVIKNYVDIANELEKLGSIELDKKKIYDYIETIRGILYGLKVLGEDTSLADIINQTALLFSNIKSTEIIKNYVDIAKEFQKLTGIELDKKKMHENINAIQGILYGLKVLGEDTSLADIINQVAVLFQTLKGSEIVEAYKGVANSLKEIGEVEIDPKNMYNNIAMVKGFLFGLKVVGEDTTLADIINQSAELFDVITSSKIVVKYKEIAEQLKEISDIEIDTEKMGATIKIIRDFLNSLKKLGDDTSLKDSITQTVELFDVVTSSKILTKYKEIADKLKELQDVKLDSEKINANLKIVRDSIGKLNSGSFIDNVKNLGKGNVSVDTLTLATSIFKEFNNIANQINTLQSFPLDADKASKNIQILKNAVESISSFATGDIVANLSGMNVALQQMLDTLFGAFPPKFAELGKLLASKLNEAFKNTLDFNKAVQQRLGEINTSTASNAGKSLADSLNRTFGNQLKLTEVIVSAINNALDREYQAQINVLTQTTNTTVTSSAKTSPGTPRIPKLTDSIIRAGGGLVTTDKEFAVVEDTPEKHLAKNGEYWFPKKVVDKIGVPNLEALRHGNLSPTLARLGQKISNTSSNVYNYVNNYNTRNQSLNVYSQVAPDPISISDRRLR